MYNERRRRILTHFCELRRQNDLPGITKFRDSCLRRQRITVCDGGLKIDENLPKSTPASILLTNQTDGLQSRAQQRNTIAGHGSGYAFVARTIAFLPCLRS